MTQPDANDQSDSNKTMMKNGYTKMHSTAGLISPAFDGGNLAQTSASKLWVMIRAKCMSGLRQRNKMLFVQ